MNYRELEERPYIDSFHYIEDLGEKLQDRKLIKINRFLQEDRIKKQKEIERLNNIINELEKWLKYQWYEIGEDLGLDEVLNKIEELKGSEKE